MFDERLLGATAFTAYVAFLLWRGLRPRLGFASWHMFAQVDKCSFRLRYGDGHEFNPWDYLPKFYIVMSRATCLRYLAFLRQRHGVVDLEGSIDTICGVHEGTMKVERSHVVD